MTTNEAPARQDPVDPERVAQASSRIPATADIARLTSLLSLMADPVRLRILYALDVSEELCVGDLALALGANEDQVTYALRLLRTAGLVHAHKQGRVVFNRLADDFPEALRQHCLNQLVQLSRDATDDGNWHPAHLMSAGGSTGPARFPSLR